MRGTNPAFIKGFALNCVEDVKDESGVFGTKRDISLGTYKVFGIVAT